MSRSALPRGYFRLLTEDPMPHHVRHLPREALSQLPPGYLPSVDMVTSYLPETLLNFNELWGEGDRDTDKDIPDVSTGFIVVLDPNHPRGYNALVILRNLDDDGHVIAIDKNATESGWRRGLVASDIETDHVPDMAFALGLMFDPEDWTRTLADRTIVAMYTLHDERVPAHSFLQRNGSYGDELPPNANWYENPLPLIRELKAFALQVEQWPIAVPVFAGDPEQDPELREQHRRAATRGWRGAEGQPPLQGYGMTGHPHQPGYGPPGQPGVPPFYPGAGGGGGPYLA